MPRIFISYRRDDTQTMTGRIYDRLVKAFKKGNVFKDVNSIEAGDDFPEKIDIAIRECDVLLVVMWRRWVSANGLKRLQNSDDWVRLEIEKAIDLKKLIIPVLINSAKMPSLDKLPSSLRTLGTKQAERVRDDPDFDTDVKRLIRKIKKQFPTKTISISTPDELKFDWNATFFPTTNFTGTGIPVAGINDLKFNWGTGVPAVNGVNVPGIGADNFSARFTATANIPTSNYKMIVASKDGIRVYLDGAVVLDKFVGRHLTQDDPIKLPKGVHNLTVEYFHGIDQAIIQVTVRKVKN